MSYSREWNIRWEQLAPDFQAKFKWIQDTIDGTRAIIDKNSKDISELETLMASFFSEYEKVEELLDKTIKELEKKIENKVIHLPDKTDQGFDKLWEDGFYGQLAKIDGHSLFPSDDFQFLNFLTSWEELDYMKQFPPITMQEVMNNWYRYAHFDSAKTHRKAFARR